MTRASTRMIATSTDRGNRVLATSSATALATADCLTLTGVNGTAIGAVTGGAAGLAGAGGAAGGTGPAGLGGGGAAAGGRGRRGGHGHGRLGGCRRGGGRRGRPHGRLVHRHVGRRAGLDRLLAEH